MAEKAAVKETAVKKAAAKKKTTAKKTTKSSSLGKSKPLVILESPHKVKTLKKILGSNYKIEASVGHVRDLPKSELGIDTDNDFEPKYITIRGKGELLAKLRKEAKTADKVYLATDPDREGEAIAWHLRHVLNLDESKTARITFNELTANAVKKSIKEAHSLNMNLVDAQQGRRALDRILGYKLSPLLWKKVKKGLSAGRVQSVALKIICDREAEIENFNPVEYWTIDAQFQKGKEKFTAKYGAELNSKAETDKVLADTKDADFVVSEIKKGTRTRKPLAPLITSTLQQEGSRSFGFATSKTMMVAQQLYEGVDVTGHGTIALVSYIRTDSTRISDEAFDMAKTYITETFGGAYAVNEKPVYKQRSRSQDAHEAIRPTDVKIKPDMVKDSLTKDQFKLYNLIWQRFVASCMTPAVYDTVQAKITANNHIFRASGSKVNFDGYQALRLKSDDEDEKENLMPELTEQEILKPKTINAEQHFTQPPPRYNEATIVKALEENGVGRPSTYAPTISTIVYRGYVTKEKNVLYMTELGEIVNEIMEENFKDIVDVDFTVKIEQELDRVEDGEIEWKDVLRRFYGPFEEQVKIAEEKVSEIEIKDEVTDVKCDLCDRFMVIKIGRFGKFLACPGFPECRNAKPLLEEAGVNCPICNKQVMIKKSKKGRRFYGCEDTTCEFISWNKPTGGKCPNCGEHLVEKGTNKPKIACSGGKCGYSIDM